MRPSNQLFAVVALAGLGCGSSTSGDELTWHADIEPIVQQRCATCHQDGSFAPFSLTTYEEMTSFAPIVAMAIENGSMPPWKPIDTCNTYQHAFDLPDAEAQAVLDWIEAEMPEGDPASAPPPVEPPEDTFRADLVVQLPEPYAPVTEPDDYRCQIVDPGLTEPTYVTGLRVTPDQEAIVHHTIVFVASADQVAGYVELDDAEEGPGYTCFGGPNGGSLDPAELQEWFASLSPGDIAQLLQGQQPDGVEVPASLAGFGSNWLGSWVPGTPNPPFPEGTGVLLQPGDQLIVQMHYNTLSAEPVADQSSIALMLAKDVERPAVVIPFTDIGWVTGIPLFGEPMDIPAGSPNASASTESGNGDLILRNLRSDLGLGPDDDMLIHRVGLHMHELGRTGRLSKIEESGAESCVLQIDDWDFAWQGSYTLTEPMRFGPDDALRLACTWDNSPENQPIVDGVPLEPRDVTWGEGTTDEMCLGTLYVTGP